MFRALLTVSALASFCFNAAFALVDCNKDNLATYYCYDDQYCCGYMSCCDGYDSVWGLWYFWLIVVLVLGIISSCVGYCVRAAKLRQMARYQRLARTQNTNYGTSTRVNVEQVATPYSSAAGGSVAPPPYGAVNSTAKLPDKQPPSPPTYQP